MDLIQWADLVDRVCEMIDPRAPIDLEAATDLAKALLFGGAKESPDFQFIANDRSTHWEFIVQPPNNDRIRTVLYIGKQNRVLTMSPRGILAPSPIFSDQELQALIEAEKEAD
ncbi:MAG: hypothetical protein P1V97_25930 [Planctomycetota bacterium]|nr:hypothetical protein [Planctomycetota bacterium]